MEAKSNIKGGESPINKDASGGYPGLTLYRNITYTITIEDWGHKTKKITDAASAEFTG